MFYIVAYKVLSLSWRGGTMSDCNEAVVGSIPTLRNELYSFPCSGNKTEYCFVCRHSAC